MKKVIKAEAVNYKGVIWVTFEEFLPLRGRKGRLVRRRLEKWAVETFGRPPKDVIFSEALPSYGERYELELKL